jgi:hypothetical protein
MLTPRSTLTRRILSALDASPSRIPVLVGGCGSGRTTLIQQLRDRAGRAPTLSINVERTATTPERFRNALAAASPVAVGDAPAAGARAAFDATIDFFNRARTLSGDPITFLLDEFLEFRTFESFPGLRRVLHELVEAIALSGNRFVLTSRYVVRTLRLLRDRSARFEVIHMPGLSFEDTLDIVGMAAAADAADAAYTARMVHALTDGRPSYVRALTDELATMRAHRGGDPMSALVSLLVPDGRVSTLCRFCYELRLHRARGYGALKAILDILGEEEGLTLTEIAQRLRRTPGSTKDYLSWLEDVDLVTSQQKRYSFSDPLLRVWVRLHCRATSPSDVDLSREVHHYAHPRLPPQEPALAMASAGAGASGIIEID